MYNLQRYSELTNKFTIITFFVEIFHTAYIGKAVVSTDDKDLVTDDCNGEAGSGSVHGDHVLSSGLYFSALRMVSFPLNPPVR
jgi:hypothetical protein